MMRNAPGSVSDYGEPTSKMLKTVHVLYKFPSVVP